MIANIISNTGNFVSGHQTNLFYQSHVPAGQTRAVLAITHGLGEYAGRYRHLYNDLVPKGYACYAFDLRGHGRSAGRRGYVDRWDDYRQDLCQFLNIVSNKEPGKPLFLFGHSLGGLMVLDYALHDSSGLTGVIVSAPAVIQTAISPAKLLIARILSELWPKFTLHTGLNPTGISRDPQERAAYVSDEYVHDYGTARLGREGELTQAYVLANMNSFSLPLLVVHGEDDPLIPLRSSQTIFDLTPTADKELIVYPGGYHESHNDLHRLTLFADLNRWMSAHLA